MELVDKLISSFPAGAQPWTLAICAVGYFGYSAWKSHFSAGAKLKEIREKLELLKLADEFDKEKEASQLGGAKKSVLDELVNLVIEGGKIAQKRAAQKSKTKPSERLTVFAGIFLSSVVFIGERMATLRPSPEVTEFLLWMTLFGLVVSTVVFVQLFAAHLYQIINSAFERFLFGFLSGSLAHIFGLFVGVRVFVGLVELFR